MFTIRVRPGARSAPPTTDDDLDVHSQNHTAQELADEVRDTVEADPHDLERLREFASETGLAIIEIDVPQRRVVVWATAGTVARAFQITFAHYRHAGKVRRGQLGIIQLPPAIADVVEDISGLDSSLPEWVSSAILARGSERIMGRQLVNSLLLVVVGGALIAGGIFLYEARVAQVSSRLQTSRAGQTVAQRPTADPAPSTPMSFPQGAVPSQPSASGATLQDLQKYELAGWSALDAGRVRDAQDNFLKVLTLEPGRHSAMQGLVAVRRKIAADNPRVIRQEVAAYQDAISREVASVDGYSPAALKLLVSAGLTAAQEIEAQTVPPIPAVPAPSPGTVPSGPPGHPALAADARGSGNGQPAHSAAAAPAPLPTPVPSRGEPQRPAPQPPKAPTKPVEHPAAPPAPQAQKPPVAAAPQKPPVQPAPTPPPQAPRATTPAVPPASPPAPNRLYTVRIGPVADHDRATAISTQLSFGGFSQVQVSTQTGYRVVSEPLPRKDAESLITRLAAQGLHSYAVSLRGDTVELLFGIFTVQKDAEIQAGRVAAAGYDAWIREGVAYTLRLGPYPSASVSTITDIVKTAASEATVTTEPVP